ncbi:MAG TPA: thioredoxin family protein [Armatimonadota bacterium]|jgi:thiol:disulfide interchange protein
MAIAGNRSIVALALVVAAVAAIPYAMRLSSRPVSQQPAAYAARPVPTGRITMIDFYTDWCGWCKKMDADTYSKPAVKEALKAYTVRRVNPEKDKGGAELAKNYKVEGFPTIVFVDAKGALVHKIVGYEGPEAFLKELKALRKR